MHTWTEGFLWGLASGNIGAFLAIAIYRLG